MNRINIDHLTEAELIDLNHRIVQRLRLFSQAHARKAMLEFRIGDRVTFEPDVGTPVFGIVTRYNKKIGHRDSRRQSSVERLRPSCVWLNQPLRQQKHKKPPIRAP